jgi:hypothetical protein
VLFEVGQPVPVGLFQGKSQARMPGLGPDRATRQTTLGFN